MKKVSEIIASIENDEVRERAEKTVATCMEAICCKVEDVMSFEVYDTSKEIFKKMLEKMENEFLLVIAEDAKKCPDRKVIIFCITTMEIDDEITIIKKNKTELHCIINLSKATTKYLEQKEETK